MDEITVLDYLKFKLQPKNWGKELLPESVTPDFPEEGMSDGPSAENPADGFQRVMEHLRGPVALGEMRLSPALLLLGLIAAVCAQIFMEPEIMQTSGRLPWVGGGLYFLSACCLICAWLLGRREDTHHDDEDVDDVVADGTDETDTSAESLTVTDTADAEVTEVRKGFAETVRLDFLAVAMGCVLFAFILFGGNRFTFLNLTCWGAAILFSCAAFSELPRGENLFSHLFNALRAVPARLGSFSQGIPLRINAWNCLCILVFLIGVWFRFTDLNTVPLDMVSDQAEKLYDVMDVLDGKTPIFFTRNTGREAFQFYWTVLMIKIFGTGVSFLSLKIGAAFAGIFILPFVYSLGKRFGNRWVGLVAMLFCGTAYWPNVIGRVALRFAFYPMFTAPALYFLYRGLREFDRKSLIWSGVFMGMGLHGYSSFRVVPVLAVLIFVTYLFSLPKESRGNALKAFAVLVFFAFVIFLPLGRVMVDMPEAVIYRAVTRLGESETAFERSPVGIFFSNLLKSLLMPFWDDGRTWVHSIVFRPALDHLTGAFFFIGVIFALLRFARRRRWEDIWMVMMIPILLLPSVLSLAFPNENPCLNRTGAAVIPMMVLAAFGFVGCFETLTEWLRRRTGLCSLTVFAAVVILLNVLSHNYDLVFLRYRAEYNQNAWNTAQIGEVIRGFNESIGRYEDAYVIPNPHWVDTRLVGINAGDPKRDYALDSTLIETLPPTDRPRLFIFRDSDGETQALLQDLYPEGLLQLHTGPYTNKNFYSYIILGAR